MKNLTYNDFLKHCYSENTNGVYISPLKKKATSTKYVIKNIVTKKYLSNTYGYTKDLFKAEVLDYKFVEEMKLEISLAKKSGLKHNILGKNQRFIAINMSEA